MEVFMAKPARSMKLQNWIWVTGLTIVIALVITVMVSGMGTNGQRNVNHAHNTAQIASVAAEFDCSCGNCDKTLQNCDCPTARDTFAYITQEVEKAKYSRLEVIRMVNDRYGHLINNSILDG
jgi:cytochrome c-type biogenesis protein CcmH/NrfF